MKKAIQVKTIMLAVQDKQHHQLSPSLTKLQSPSNTFHRVDTSPSQRKFKGSKIVRRLQTDKLNRRLSQKVPKSFKSTSQNNKKSYGEAFIETTSAFTTKKSCNRYDRPLIPEEKMQHSYSNMKLNSIKQNEMRNDSVLRPSFYQQAKTSMNWTQVLDNRKNRIKSQPTNPQFKEQIMKRVEKKIQFMKKMTLDGDIQNPFVIKGQKTSQIPSKLFNFDRLYDHCLKKLNKGINFYEKDIGRSKDRKYYELKIQSSILSHELKSMRKTLSKKKDTQQNNLGVIGSFIDVSKIQKGQRLNTQRQSQCRNGSSCYKKKLGRLTKNIQGRNPFAVDQLHGWEIRCQKNQEFYL